MENVVESKISTQYKAIIPAALLFLALSTIYAYASILLNICR